MKNSYLALSYWNPQIAGNTENRGLQYFLLFTKNKNTKFVPMAIFDKLKSIFIETEEDGSSSNSSTPNSSAKVSASDAKTTTTDRPSSQVSMTGQSTEKFLEILAQVLEKNNQPGFDYLEYKKAVQSVSKLQSMDEATQFRTAFAAAQAMNVNPADLINSAKKYLSVLDLEQQNFNASAAQFLKNQVNQKEMDGQQLAQSIKQKEEQIEQLKKDLAEAQSRLQQISSEIDTAKNKVEQNKSNFSVSYQSVVDQIKQDIQKMEQFLK